MDRKTIAVYEQVATAWRDRRPTQRRARAAAFAFRVRNPGVPQAHITIETGTIETDTLETGTIETDTLETGTLEAGSSKTDTTGATSVIVDLGCGPGGHLEPLGSTAFGVDASIEMLRLAQRAHPQQSMVCADIEHLPFRTGSIDGAWASKSYVHLPRSRVPAALAELHRAMAVGGRVCAVVFAGDTEFGPAPNDDFPGRSFSTWPLPLLRAVLVGAGFVIDAEEVSEAKGLSAPGITVEAVSIRSSPDVIGPDMQLLACGLNPSPASADSGVAYARAGNRFWPAALTAGLASIDRDPEHALANHGLGLADLVKRTSRKASEVSREEFEEGMARLEVIAAWLQPQVICFVGLSGYRSVADPKAEAGPLPRLIGGCRVYLMPSTSGLNAHSKPADFVAHLHAAKSLAAEGRA